MQKPNILFILDNLGYGELGVYGGGEGVGDAWRQLNPLRSDQGYTPGRRWMANTRPPLFFSG